MTLHDLKEFGVTDLRRRMLHGGLPDFLLAPGELLEAVRGRLRVVAYEDLVVAAPRPAAVQRLCARREDGS